MEKFLKLCKKDYLLNLLAKSMIFHFEEFLIVVTILLSVGLSLLITTLWWFLLLSVVFWFGMCGICVNIFYPGEPGYDYKHAEITKDNNKYQKLYKQINS